LIHHHRPDLITFDDKDPNNAAENLDAAFDAAEKIGVPKLLDTADIVNMDKPDERSIMTYCAALYKVFSSYDKVEGAAKRLGKFLNFAKQVEEMIHDYEARARALKESTVAKTGELQAAGIPSDYAPIRSAIQGYKEYRKTTKRGWIVESGDLSVLFSNIQAKLRMMSRPLYVPPEGLKPEDLEASLTELTSVERSYHSKLAQAMRQVLDQLRKTFADLANSAMATIEEYKKLLAAEQDMPIDQQADFYTGKRQELVNSVAGQLPAIEQAEQECEAANIDENEYCDYTYDDVKFTYERILADIDKKIIFVQSQALEAQSGVSADKMAEFRESFDTFNTKKGDGLDKLEFRSAVTSLGLIEVDFSKDNNSECDQLFDKVRAGQETVSFENWVDYMTSISADACSAEQAGEALAAIAGGKTFITEQDLINAHLPQEQIDYLKEKMPQNENGYDYKAWVASY